MCEGVMYFYYKVVLAAALSYDSNQDYRTLYPEHERWLQEHGVQYRVTNYVWPSLLTRAVAGQVGMEACELCVEIPDEVDAFAFASFSGMTPTDSRSHVMTERQRSQ